MMDATREQASPGELTLGFELEAFEAFEQPNAVIRDARTWSRYVGLIAADPDAAGSYARTHELNLDFLPGDRDKWLALQEIHGKTNTERHVLVGRSTDGRLAAEHTGWEFVPLEEAAEKAGWELADRSNRTAKTAPETGVFAWLRRWL